MKRTVVIDENGEQLATFPDILEQVLVEQPEFYLGQQCYDVLRIEFQNGEQIITVRKHEDGA